MLALNEPFFLKKKDFWGIFFPDSFFLFPSILFFLVLNELLHTTCIFLTKLMSLNKLPSSQQSNAMQVRNQQSYKSLEV